MTFIDRKHLTIWVVALWIFGVLSGTLFADSGKVLVVMSYEQSFPWCQEIKEGIDHVLDPKFEIRYYYLNTKVNASEGPERAKTAWALFQSFQPDGVIAVDDNAQSMFVVPYLREKVETPVMFCGVNGDPDTYGYPANNVSGILERYHIDQSIAFAKQILPSIQTVGFMVRKSTTGDAVFRQVSQESDRYALQSVGVFLPTTMEEAVSQVKALNETCDLLMLTALEGLLDSQGDSMTQAMIIPELLSIFRKPTFSTSPHQLNYGVLCAVVQSGQEHGKTAARMLLQAMSGKPVTTIPMTRNRRGKRMINATTLKALNIKPSPSLLRGVELIRTTESVIK